jgi:hypothetical protein
MGKLKFYDIDAGYIKYPIKQAAATNENGFTE